MNDDYDFEMSWKVRDYECDLQGIVNNAIYMHYLEFTRNEFLNQTGTNLGDLHAMGIDIVLARITMSLKTPLRPGDEVLSKMKISKEKIKYVFNQDLYRKSDNKIVCRAIVELVSLINGKLGNSKIVDKLLLTQIKDKNDSKFS